MTPTNVSSCQPPETDIDQHPMPTSLPDDSASPEEVPPVKQPDDTGLSGIEDLPYGVFHGSSIVKHYHDRELDHEYTIKFRPEPNGIWTIWALKSPANPYGGTAKEHHLYESGEVCVADDAKPRSLDRAVAIAIYWMNRYSIWVTEGRFPKSSGRVNV